MEDSGKTVFKPWEERLDRTKVGKDTLQTPSEVWGQGSMVFGLEGRGVRLSLTLFSDTRLRLLVTLIPAANDLLLFLLLQFVESDADEELLFYVP